VNKLVNHNRKQEGKGNGVVGRERVGSAPREWRNKKRVYARAPEIAMRT